MVMKANRKILTVVFKKNIHVTGTSVYFLAVLFVGFFIVWFVCFRQACEFSVISSFSFFWLPLVHASQSTKTKSDAFLFVCLFLHSYTFALFICIFFASLTCANFVSVRIVTWCSAIFCLISFECTLLCVMHERRNGYKLRVSGRKVSLWVNS